MTNTTFVQIGINYTGTAKELNGCVNDAKNVREFLMSRFHAFHTTHRTIRIISSTGQWNFKSRDIWILTDDTRNPKNLPTKANIINAMRWLVSGACANDSLFIHCKWDVPILEHSPMFPQIPVTVGKSATLTAMSLMGTMKVSGGGCNERPLQQFVSHFPPRLRPKGRGHNF